MPEPTPTGTPEVETTPAGTPEVETTPAEHPRDIREQVRQRYAIAAGRPIRQPAGCCEPRTRPEKPDVIDTGTSTDTEPTADADADAHSATSAGIVTDGSDAMAFGSALYAGLDLAGAETAVEASLGCGLPTEVADLHPGETVLDLGSGAGGDVLIAAARVGPGGRVIGVDMTSEMLDLARANAAAAGVCNVSFVCGYLEDLPLPDGSVDVVISNCVINLAADKSSVLTEAARVTRSGGRFAVSDVIADDDLDQATRADLAAWTGCIAGALTEDDYRRHLSDAGWSSIEIRYTHPVHTHARAAIIRAVRR